MFSFEKPRKPTPPPQPPRKKAMKIYIAGKITGLGDYRVFFTETKRELTGKGHIVLNPAELPEGMTPGDYMRICFAMIDTADAVYFMRGYRESRGAMVEMEYCKYIGKPIIHQEGP